MRSPEVSPVAPCGVRRAHILQSWHHSPAVSTSLRQIKFSGFSRLYRPSRPSVIMSSIASKVSQLREKNRGVGTNSQAVKYLNQDYESLRRSCLESRRLFQDDTFPALPSSLGFQDLGSGSYKIRGVSWQRPTVGDELQHLENRIKIFVQIGPKLSTSR